MKSENSTRVIAGRYKGRKILLPDLEGTRPTKNIVRESLFDTLQTDLHGHAFVEVFAGSGSVGIEASSRGCDNVCFIEADRTAYATLQKNIKTLGIEGARTWQGDSFLLLKEAADYLRLLRLKGWFYFDPPFDIRQGQQDVYAKTEALIAALNPEQVQGVVIEHRSEYAPAETLGACSLVKRRKFGKTTLSYYAPAV
ncbi:MAG: 16S rRNA (guanine(966)-N(2))-methyltransferase RsmD [Campylobacterales bacterium]